MCVHIQWLFMHVEINYDNKRYVDICLHGKDTSVNEIKVFIKGT